MKTFSMLMAVLLAGLLPGAQAQAEKGMMQMEERTGDAGDMPMREQEHENMMEQHHDDGAMHERHEAMQDNAMHDKAMDEPLPLEEQSGFSRGSVVRSVFTTAVRDREPADSVRELDTHSDKVIYYTELRDMAGQTAKHRWEHNGKVMAEVEFKVGGSRWRVWSSKSLVPGWTGEWKVSVLNGANEVISEDVFNYKPAMDEAEATH